MATKSEEIINELTKWYDAQTVKNFVEGHPKFLPHEVRDILAKVAECSASAKEDIRRDGYTDGHDDGYHEGHGDGEEEERARECKWKFDEEYGAYDTSCENAQNFIEGGIKENKYEFCPYCRGKIVDGGKA